MRHYSFRLIVAPVFLLGLVAGCSPDSKDVGSEKASQLAKKKDAADTNVEPVSLPPLRPTFQTRIPADCDNLLYIADALPHLERMLSSPALRRALTTGKLAGSSQLLQGKSLDPAEAIPVIRENRAFIPDEIAIGLDDDSLGRLGQLAKIGLLVGLSSGAADSDDKSASTDIPKLSTELFEQVQSFQLPRCTVWVRFRDDGVADQLFKQLQTQLTGLVAESNLEIVANDNSFGIEAKLGDVYPSFVVRIMLTELGVSSDAPNLGEIADAVAKLELKLWIENTGDGLRVTLGPRPKDNQAAYDIASLGPLWKPTSNLVMYGRWNTTSLLKQLGESKELWKRWEETPTGRATKSKDSEDMLGDLNLVHRQLGQAGSMGSMRLNVDDKVEATVQSVGNKPVASLVESNLTQFIPGDAEVAILDATTSAGDHLSGLLSRFEDRMATNSLKYEFGNRAREGQWLETMSTFYYSKLAAFRKLAHTESLSVFEPPYAMLMGSKGDNDNLTVRFNSAEGKPNRVTIRDVPMLEYAVVARLKNLDQPLDFPAQVWTAFLSGFFDKSSESSVTRNDLGLGEETYTFDGSFWNKIPGKAQVSIKGDLLPHYFRIDEQWVVFSTSVRLSKSIIAARSNDKERFVLPDNNDSQLIGFGRIPSGTVANYFEYTGVVIGDVLGARQNVELEGDMLQTLPQVGGESIGDMLVGIAEVARLMDRVQWLTTQDKDVRTTRFSITFVD